MQNEEFKGEGTALNHMSSDLQTPYFTSDVPFRRQ